MKEAYLLQDWRAELQNFFQLWHLGKMYLLDFKLQQHDLSKKLGSFLLQETENIPFPVVKEKKKNHFTSKRFTEILVTIPTLFVGSEIHPQLHQLLLNFCSRFQTAEYLELNFRSHTW